MHKSVSSSPAHFPVPSLKSPSKHSVHVGIQGAAEPESAKKVGKCSGNSRPLSHYP